MSIEWEKTIVSGQKRDISQWFNVVDEKVILFKNQIESAFNQIGQVTHSCIDGKNKRVGVLALSVSGNNRPVYFTLDNISGKINYVDLLAKCITASGLLESNPDVKTKNIVEENAFKLAIARYDKKLDKVIVLDNVDESTFELDSLYYSVLGNVVEYYCILSYDPSLPTGIRPSYCCIL